LRHSRANAESVLSAPALPGTSTPLVADAAAQSASAQVGYTSARARLTVPVPEVKGAEIFGLAEEAIDGGGGREDAIGGTYAVNATTRIYAQHDFINSLNGPYTLNPSVSQYSTVAGISSTLPTPRSCSMNTGWATVWTAAAARRPSVCVGCGNSAMASACRRACSASRRWRGGQR